ncbi:hypothetical protein BDY17DRAFT_289631 [Neohortaea acidophila]|uniref:F-box domain-containing protein n=1 Tax=Neohortaea acidophila TaxID=245834 RepID=A0A6A6Q6R0_9PEZI|nr:uncharacterized protein BDY17DRAFT_289631 [Neohortaea acidophila]KAF2487761.1 hypothetical protein BDY17DRAFT_289631 [Neohortaea acidophila]
MAEKLVEAFSAVPPEDRTDALSKLLCVLHPAERSHLSKMMAQQNDPMFALPIDIVLQVFEYLDVLAIWSLRSVCKHWQYVLSSESVVKSALARWQMHDEADTASPSQRTATYSTESRIQHLRALITGDPFEEIPFDRPGLKIPLHLPQMAAFRFCFKGSRFAYIASRPQKGDQVVVHDLITGECRIFCSEARGTIRDVVITTNLVAFVAFDGYLYVSRFRDPGTHCDRIRIPSSKMCSLAAEKDSIALLLTPYTTHTMTSVLDLILYDDVTRQSRSVDVSKQLEYMTKYDTHFCTSLVQSDRKVIDFFTLNSVDERKHEGLHLVHSRLSFQGEQVRGQSRLYLAEPRMYGSRPFVLANPHPTGIRDQCRLAVGEVRRTGAPWLLKSARLFDCKHGEFIDGQSPPDNPRPEDGFPAMNLLWKAKAHQPPGEEEWMPYMAYMNDTFMVSLECTEGLADPPRTRLRAFCYDPNVKMVGRR